MQGEDSANQWQGSDRRGMSAAKLRHVNGHLTPLAAIIVIPGLLVAPLPTRAVVVAGVLIAFSVILNYVSIYLMDRHVRLIGTVRVATNDNLQYLPIVAALRCLGPGVAATASGVGRGSRLPGSSRFTDGRECHCPDAARGTLELWSSLSIGLDRGRGQGLDYYTDQPFRQWSQ